MKIKEIRELSTEELGARSLALRNETFQMRIQQQSGQLERPSRLRSVYKDIARVETVLSERRTH